MSFGFASTAGSTPAKPAAPLFGSPAAAPAAFGAPAKPAAPTSLFGAAAPAAAAPAFGFGAPAAATPAPGLFGAPAAAPAAGLFGAPAPAPAGLFGAPAVPPASTGLFGAPAVTPAPATGLFGAAAPAPASGLFGASAPAPGMFGAAATAAPIAAAAQPQGSLPSYNYAASYQLEQMHAEQRKQQEAAGLQASLSKLHAAYTATPTTVTQAQPNAPGTSSSRFQAMVYDPSQSHPHLNPTNIAAGIEGRPPHVTPQAWSQSLATNPDPLTLLPICLVGANALQTRIASQQEQALILKSYLEKLREAVGQLQQSTRGSEAMVGEIQE
eukprot:CAMPEP_0194406550 /NCGR_PEP_ID=MMETSP0176-20130528/4721_1 /TAXON_ID=216777 /ORGANISM="Proboscia alata, Strain PI-D3" /LENGTH=325 /DNA_ID=CAMNT_0039205797 /DNA_START=132 /DNA_END=1106 /DNA_ORIENTATION=+